MIEKIQKLKKSGKIVGFTASTAELAHPGFIDMLLQAKKNCDYLIFGLLTDPSISRPLAKNKPIESTFERWVRLSAIKYIDMIIPFDTEEDLENMIKLISPSVRFVGEEYKGTEHTGWNLCPIIYNKRTHNWSSSGLRKKIYEIELAKENRSNSDEKLSGEKLQVDQHEPIDNNKPINLIQCFLALNKLEDNQKWCSLSEDDALAQVHHSIGRMIRNEWDLWSGGPLKDYFLSIGLEHPDDISSVILRSYHRFKNRKPIEMQKQVEYYKKYWETPEENREDYVIKVRTV